MNALFWSVLLISLTGADWASRVAVSDAVVTVKSTATPELPDDQNGSGAVKIQPKEPQAKLERTEGPIVDVTVWVSADCYHCSTALHEIKSGGGKRKIRFIIQDFDFPATATGLPYYQWHDGQQLRYRSGVISRQQLEGLITKTELEAIVKKGWK